MPIGLFFGLFEQRAKSSRGTSVVGGGEAGQGIYMMREGKPIGSDRYA
jgi:hypothetical protein